MKFFETILFCCFAFTLCELKAISYKTEWMDVSAGMNGIEKHGSIELRCDSDLHYRSSSVIKWYKDEKEFFRYTTNSKDPIQTFDVKGIQVVKQYSDGEKVLLENLGSDSAGEYRCRVRSNEDKRSKSISLDNFDFEITSNGETSVSEGSFCLLRCYFVFSNDSSQEWEWKWYKDGQLFYHYLSPNSIETFDVPKMKLNLNPNWEYKGVMNVLPEEVGVKSEYKCQAIHSPPGAREPITKEKILKCGRLQ